MTSETWNHEFLFRYCPQHHEPSLWLRARNFSTTWVVYVIEELVYSTDEPVVVGLPDHVPRVRKDGDFQVSTMFSVHFDVFWFEQGSLGTAAYQKYWRFYR